MYILYSNIRIFEYYSNFDYSKTQLFEYSILFEQIFKITIFTFENTHLHPLSTHIIAQKYSNFRILIHWNTEIFEYSTIRLFDTHFTNIFLNLNNGPSLIKFRILATFRQSRNRKLKPKIEMVQKRQFIPTGNKWLCYGRGTARRACQ